MGKDRDADPPGRLGQDRREAPDCPGHEDIARPERAGGNADRRSPEEAPAPGETGPEDEG